MTPDYDVILLNIENLFVPSALSEEAHYLMEQSLASSKAGITPDALIIAGDPGTGKTSIVKAFADQHLPFEIETGRQVPVAYCELEANSKVNDLTVNLLETLGIPFSYRARVRELRRVLRRGIKNLGLHMLIIDESQQVVENRSKGIQYQFIDEIKLLIGQTKLAIVLTGTPGLLQASVTNSQLDRRANKPLVLNSLNFAEPSDQKVLMETVGALVQVCEHVEFPDLLNEDTLWRLYFACSGNKGQLAHLFRQCILDCRSNQCPLVTYDALALATARAIKTLPLDGTNPFKDDFNLRPTKSAIKSVLGIEGLAARAMRKLVA